MVFVQIKFKTVAERSTSMRYKCYMNVKAITVARIFFLPLSRNLLVSSDVMTRHLLENYYLDNITYLPLWVCSLIKALRIFVRYEKRTWSDLWKSKEALRSTTTVVLDDIETVCRLDKRMSAAYLIIKWTSNLKYTYNYCIVTKAALFESLLFIPSQVIARRKIKKIQFTLIYFFFAKMEALLSFHTKYFHSK